MKRAKSINALLIEIMIDVLFFALCSSVILEMFLFIRNMSSDVENRNSAMIDIQNIAEQMYATDDALFLLENEGFCVDRDVMRIERDGYSVIVRASEVETVGGVIFNAEITAMGRRGVIAQIPCARYIAGEVH